MKVAAEAVGQSSTCYIWTDHCPFLTQFFRSLPGCQPEQAGRPWLLSQLHLPGTVDPVSKAHDTPRSLCNCETPFNIRNIYIYIYVTKFLMININTFVFMATQCSKDVNAEYGKESAWP